MRLNNGAPWMVCIALAAVWPLPPAYGQQRKPDSAPGAAAGADRKDTQLTLKDIQEQRRQRISPEQVADNVAEQGRGFEVTAEVADQLRSLGFRPAQIDAIKESSPESLVPGRWLTTSDAERDETFKEMRHVAVRSKAAIEPIQSQHVTLWAAKEAQESYLADVQKLEKFFHTKCAEPIRSGLDKRSTHVVLLKDHAEYEAWCRAMFDLFGKQFETNDNPGANEEFKSQTLKGSVFNGWHFSAISVGEEHFDWARRDAAANVGMIYFAQLANASQCGPLETGFADGAEAVVTGSPSVMYSSVGYHEEERKLGADPRAWLVLVQRRMATNKATPLGKLLQMDSYHMLQPHHAEGWTLVGLLNKQPVKFGKLLLEMRKGGSDLEAIEKVYGWDEKKLTLEWHKYVMAQKNKAVRSSD